MSRQDCLCAQCGVAVPPDESCAECGGDPVLEDRYVLLAVLGRRGSATTFRALDRHDQRDVVVKELVLRATKELKELELFEREAEALARLEQPKIPKLVAHFSVQRPKTIGLYVVQELFEGESLEQIARGKRFTAGEVAEILADLLELMPVLAEAGVIHRDIKPANIVQRESGDLALVDFGAARLVTETQHRAGSTMTGTFGYMAPEQMVGFAVPQTDVFALGATGLRLLTGIEPHEMWSNEFVFDYNREGIDSGFAALLDWMTAADPDDRPADHLRLAAELREFAAGKSRALARYGGALARPAGRHQELESPSLDRAWDGFSATLRTHVAAMAIAAILGLYAAEMVAQIAGVVWVAGWIRWAFCAVAVGAAATPLVVEALGRWRRARLLATGNSIRGVVLDRSVRRRTFSIGYQYEAAGERHAAKLVGTQSDFLSVEAGDEIGVWYDPDDPTRSTALVLGPRVRLK